MATRNRRWSRPAAEAALVMVAIGLMVAAAGAGFAVGRATAEDGAGSAEQTQPEETTAPTETAETETAATETETAETETQGQTETGGGETGDTGEGPEGSAVFAEAGCGGCHTLSAANASGTVGPNLDETELSKDEIEQVVRNGRNGMPAFEGRLSDEQIEAVADYVENAGSG